MAVIESYYLGELVRCKAIFTSSTGALEDPDNIYFQVKTPSNVTTSYTYGIDAELVKDATGQYYIDIDANEEGSWKYRFHSTGSGQAAQEGGFDVLTSNF